jgi:dolichol-phosphate mannosyltransferase
MRRFVLAELPEDAPDFKGFNQRALTALRGYSERVRFIRGILASIGFRQTEIPYTRDARYAGCSKYPLARVLRFAGDAIVSFSILPLRLSLFAGLLTWAGLLAYLAILITAWPFTGALASGLAVLMVTLACAFSGLVLVSLGIIGEYLGRLYAEVQGRPLYLVQELQNFSVDIPKRPR